nr:hypothetical protein [Sulfurimonas sp. SAG-AH-194-I05]
MHLTAIAEQFNKLKKEHADDILSAFDDEVIYALLLNTPLYRSLGLPSSVLWVTGLLAEWVTGLVRGVDFALECSPMANVV